MLGGWRRFNQEKPKTKNPFAFLRGRRGILSFEKGCWEFISGRPKDKINIPAVFLKELFFMDDFRGRKQLNRK